MDNKKKLKQKRSGQTGKAETKNSKPGQAGKAETKNSKPGQKATTGVKTGKTRYKLKSEEKNKKISCAGKSGEKNRKTGYAGKSDVKDICPYAKKCGSCSYQGVSYKKQLEKKQQTVEKLLHTYAKPLPIIGMENPYHYRNKVHAVFGRKRNGTPIAGIYEAGSHRIVDIENCWIEDENATKIIRDILGLLRSFKIKTYDEDSGYGLLRHVLVRTGFASGEVLLVLVLASPVLPSKNNFVKAIRRLHPEITSIVLNINDRRTSMVLGERNITLYGKGYIEDTLCGCRFRISPNSFYQINPVQTEKLYQTAIRFAGLTGKERVLDAYSGIGTIGIVAAEHAGEVICVELNPAAVRDAITNARQNHVSNISFYQKDAGEFLVEMAEQKEHVDVVFMDPPRSGSDEAFLSSVVTMQPEKVVYISCNPETQARDLAYLTGHGYHVKQIQGVDMFPFTDNIETVCLLNR